MSVRKIVSTTETILKFGRPAQAAAKLFFQILFRNEPKRIRAFASFAVGKVLFCVRPARDNCACNGRLKIPNSF